MRVDQGLIRRARERAAELERFVAHAEANRDDWYQLMPTEILGEKRSEASDWLALAELAAWIDNWLKTERRRRWRR